MPPKWPNLTMPPNELYQYSVLSALMSGVAASGVSLRELLAQGNHGLGTFKGLDGEMIILDGSIYQLKSDGSVILFDNTEHHDDVAPFAMVTSFCPSVKATISFASKEEFSRILSNYFPKSRNHFLSFKMDGLFKEITVRTVGGQQSPCESLIEVGKREVSHTFRAVSGSVVGFRSPDFAQGVTVAGDHLHFISKDRTFGGHVLACKTDGDIGFSAALIYRLHLQLPQEDNDYNEAQLETDEQGIKDVEG